MSPHGRYKEGLPVCELGWSALLPPLTLALSLSLIKALAASQASSELPATPRPVLGLPVSPKLS